MRKWTRGNFRFFGYFWLLIVFVVLLWQGIGYFNRSLHFNPELGINLVVIGEDNLGVLVLRPGDEPSSFIKLPANLTVKADGTGGEYKIVKLWELARIEGVDPGKMVSDSLGDGLGFIAGGFIKVGSDELVSPVGVKAELLRPLVKTNLWWWDRWRVRQEIGREGSAFLLLEDSLPLQVIERRSEADGVELWQLRTESVVDSWGKRIWLMEQILAENVQVEIFNHSGEVGRARQMARKLSNAGVGVVKVEEGSEEIEGCVYQPARPEEEMPKSFYLFTEILNCREVDGLGEVGVIRIGK